MYIAWDRNFKRVHIKDSIAREKYFCPYCQSPLIIRKGDVRQHHYAHAKSAVCSDTWSAERSMNDCEWHREWQDRFPIDNQEISLALGEIKHRADVMVRRTVLEFQHSSLSSVKFSNRNAFYAGLGHKVMWVFDFQKLYESGSFEMEPSNDSVFVKWTRPKHTFDDFTDTRRLDGIELYFQITEDRMLRIVNISQMGFEHFDAKEITVDGFLKNLMESDGTYAKPEPEDLSQNPEYLAFKERYHIMLNAQQERAVQTVSGANLLLAVPGSGKTAVLTTRIGFMVICKHIDPNSILALTYTKKAAEEMRTRAIMQFGDDVGKVAFKTINSFAYDILKYYENSDFSKGKMFDIISETEKTKLLRKIYRQINSDEEYPTEEDIKQLGVDITRKKNNVDLDEMKSDIPNFEKIYEEYNKELFHNKRMDYDDQNRFAVSVLKHEAILKHFQELYKYICVDEAQDTSKCQHKLIKTVSGDNIFMVGDEDQSIYSFRGAFPSALTAFETNYRNPYILRMEMNYRSHSEITEIANRFVARNTMRHPKTMTANRGKVGKVELLSYESRSEEYEQIYQRFCCNSDEETAILYRDADCGINIIAMLLKNNIPFRLLQNSTTFFTNKFVIDVTNFIRLALNPYDTDSFMEIYYKVKGAKYKKQAAANIADHAKRNHKTVLESIRGNRKGDIFADHIERIYDLADKPAAAIRYISNITDQGKTPRAPITLEILAQYVQNISQLENYLNQLKDNISKAEAKNQTSYQLTLSTIHSAKGMEFKNVIILDVNDRFIPHCTPYDIEENEDKKNLYQEERRIFYVAMTRAKDNLYIAHVAQTDSFFVDELFVRRNADKCNIRTTSTYSEGKGALSLSKKSIPSDIEFQKAPVSDYTIGSIIEHTILGIGRIIDISEIKEGVTIITIRLKNNVIDKLHLESVVKSGLIKKLR